MPPSPTPATQSTAASPATKRAQAHPSAPKRTQAHPSASPEPAQRHQRHQCHFCQTKRRSMSASATSPHETKVCVAKCHFCHAKRRRMSPSATPATRNEGMCRQVPRLPRKLGRRHRRPSAPKRAQARPSAPPEPAQCHKVAHLPRKTKVDVTKNHACHAKRRSMHAAKTHGCHAKYRGITSDQVRPSAPNRATRASPVPQARRLPRKTKVDVTKCHTCQAKRRRMSPSATPATRNEGMCR